MPTLLGGHHSGAQEQGDSSFRRTRIQQRDKQGEPSPGSAQTYGMCAPSEQIDQDSSVLCLCHSLGSVEKEEAKACNTRSFYGENQEEVPVHGISKLRLFCGRKEKARLRVFEGNFLLGHSLLEGKLWFSSACEPVYP